MFRSAWSARSRPVTRANEPAGMMTASKTAGSRKATMSASNSTGSRPCAAQLSRQIVSMWSDVS